jgi:tight adherence protein C
MTNANFETLVNLLMLFALFGTLAIWWMTKRGGQRGRIAERARDVAFSHRVNRLQSEDDDGRSGLHRSILERLATFGDRLPFFDEKQRKKLAKEMIRGGFRSKKAVSILLAVKFVIGLICAALCVTLGSHVPILGKFMVGRGALMMMGLMCGAIVPEYLLAFRGASRRRAMASCLPDALDLLVICTNAGNSLAVSIRRVADELATICPPLADEFSLTADELKLSGDSARALQNLAERIDLPSIRALISTLTQSMRYGTPISQSLRTLSRTERLASIVALEEKAAKLAPKMVLPMMLFILPAIVVIAAGPAVIKLLQFIAKQ